MIQSKEIKKSRIGTENFDICVYVIFDCSCPKVLFLERIVETRPLSLQNFEFFSNISLFRKILSRKLFGKSQGNSCMIFFALDIKYRFTCDKSDLY